ncbi:MAG: NAD(P)/FAD-dependent oxidoreductase [Candidatus Micrarchaeia archaeon]
MEKCRVLVVGAGPSGVSAAFFLKFLDKDERMVVTLVEKLKKNHYKKYHKMCGEGISKKAFQELEPIRPYGVIEKVDLIRDVYPGGFKLDIKTDGYLIDRRCFLNNVINKFQRLGGHFQNKTVVGIEKPYEKPIVSFLEGREKFDYVIAADGTNSIIRKCLGSSGGLKRLFAQFIVVGNEVGHGTLLFIYDQKYCGDYKWVFPNGKTTKIGFPLFKNINVKEEVGEKVILERHSRVVGYGGMDKYHVGRVLFIGDAAFQTNPITKGGIRSGMIAGKYAAEAILRGNPALYETKWKSSNYNGRWYMHVFTRLEKMNNRQLMEMIKAIGESHSQKYKNFAKTFELAHKYGW